MLFCGFAVCVERYVFRNVFRNVYRNMGKTATPPATPGAWSDARCVLVLNSELLRGRLRYSKVASNLPWKYYLLSDPCSCEVASW